MEEYIVILNWKHDRKWKAGTIAAESPYHALELAKCRYPFNKYGWESLTVRAVTERDMKWK